MQSQSLKATPYNQPERKTVPREIVTIVLQ